MIRRLPTAPLFRTVLPPAALLLALAAPAGAADRTDAKIQCQVEYGPQAEQGAACQRGVELSVRTPDDTAQAMNECSRGFADPTNAAACQRGVTVHARVGDVKDGSARESSFSSSWQNGRPAAQVEIGNFQVRAGDAEEQIDNCMRAFENSRVQPSCISGFSAQPKAPGSAPR